MLFILMQKDDVFLWKKENLYPRSKKVLLSLESIMSVPCVYIDCAMCLT